MAVDLATLHGPSQVLQGSQASCAQDMTFSHWRDVLEKSYGLHCETRPGHRCEVDLDARDVGEIRIAEVRMSGQTISPRCRMEPAEDQVYTKLVLGGVAMFEQNGERHLVTPDSLIVIDPGRPFVECVDASTRMIVVTCPKSALRERGYISHFKHWVAPDMASPDVRVVQDMVRLIASSRHGLRDSTREMLGTQLLDLVEVLTRVGTGTPISHTAAARFRVKRFIAQHLGDERLDATAIANGVRLSVSYLNRLFREEDTTLMRYLWAQRVERAYPLLETSRRDGLRVEEIAWRCGFSSPAHFSRLFRQRYGMTPRELRERV